MTINAVSGRGTPAAAQSSSEEQPSSVPHTAVPTTAPNMQEERTRGVAMSVPLSMLSDMSNVRRSKSELNLPRRAETAIASSSRSLREQPMNVAGDSAVGDWESVLDASIAAGDLDSREGSRTGAASLAPHMTPFGPSHSDVDAAPGRRAAWRSQSDIGLPRLDRQDLPPLRSFREPPVSASAALLVDAGRSDDDAWSVRPAEGFQGTHGKGRLGEAHVPGGMAEALGASGTLRSEEIVASWLANAELAPVREHAASPSSGPHEQQIGLSRRSGTSLPAIAEQHDEAPDAGRGDSATLSDGVRRGTGMAAMEVQAPEVAPERAAAGSQPSRGTFNGRLAQLIDNKKVPFAPPIQLARWDAESVLEVCHGLRNSQRASPPIPELARLVALNFERAHADAIPQEKQGQRILPEGTKEEVYYQEMIASFLRAVGVDDAAEVLESFKKTGTGGLHRQQVLTASTAGGVVSSVAQLAASTHPIAKTALSAVQLMLTAVTSDLSFASGGRRLRNAGTEEVLPLGKADASPSAKTGPNVLGATAMLAWRLPKITQCVKRMEKAQAKLVAAQAVLARDDLSPTECSQAEREVRAAGEELSIAYARFSYRNELKGDYKTASESAKIEYQGNKRYLGIGGASAALAITSTILGILPHAAAAAVTGGFSAAATAAIALMYVGYQLSTGPSKDGEAKAKRAIVALGKSLDLMGGNAVKQQRERAEAYRTYIHEKRLWRSPEVRANAKPKLLATLDDIARRDTTENDIKPLTNWEAYAAYRQDMETNAADPQAMHELEAAFTQAHHAEFKALALTDAWKTPYRMRMESMGRILLGKSSKAMTALLKSAARVGNAVPEESGRRAEARSQIHAGLRADVKAVLRDWVSFELAQSDIKRSLSGGDDAQIDSAMRAAAQSLAAIQDGDAQTLFTGDGRAQVEATELSKRLTAGEAERYTLTNAGPATMAAVANGFGAAGSLGLNIDKDIKLSHGIHTPPKYNDQNDARILMQGTAPVTAPYSSAERARFQKTSMAKLLGTLARNGDPVSLQLDIADAASSSMGAGARNIDAALEMLMDRLEQLADLPDDIKLSVGGRSIASGKLNGTASYFDWRYRRASAGTKAKFQARRMGIVADNMHIAITSPVSQLVAQIPLSMTRRASYVGQEMSHGVRDRLTDLAGLAGDADEETPGSANAA